MKNLLHWRIFIVVIGVGLMFFLGYRYSVYVRDTRNLAMLETSCESSGGVFKRESKTCTCPPVFPVFNKDSNTCQDRMGGHVRSREEYTIMAHRYEYAKECRGKGDEVYVLDGTPLTFCYPYSWGDPVVTKDKTTDGTQYMIMFVSSTSKRTTMSPTWWFIEGGYVPTVNDFRLSCVSCLATTTDAVILGKQLGLTSKGTITGGVYGNTTMFVARNDVRGVALYVAPRVWQNNTHVLVRTPATLDESVQSALQGMWFDEYIH